jgi:hypothetical protein
MPTTLPYDPDTDELERLAASCIASIGDYDPVARGIMTVIRRLFG